MEMLMRRAPSSEKPMRLGGRTHYLASYQVYSCHSNSLIRMLGTSPSEVHEQLSQQLP